MITKLRDRLRGKGGFSIVELMVALIISAIVGLSLYFVLTHQRKQYLSQQNASDLQQNARFIIENIGRDLIMAGYVKIAELRPGITAA